MPLIIFVSTYQPLLCGIADYLKFLLKNVPEERWRVITFDLESYQALGGRLTKERKESPRQVWYGITNRRAPSVKEILAGIKRLVKKEKKYLLWFQHTFGIWKNSRGFAKCLKELNKLKIPTIVSLHTLHFQCKDTPWGFENRKRNEYNLLKYIFPSVSAITVFSQGAYLAIKKAFPQYISKTHIIRHGIHFFPEIIKMPKREARRKIYQYLIEKSDLEEDKKNELKKENIFLNPEVLIIGNSGFIAPHKNIEKLFLLRDLLQKSLPDKKIVAIYAGIQREKGKKELKYTLKLRKLHNGFNKFFLETWLPGEILPIFQKALDINFYWPRLATQSGILAHILGTGALVAGRDIEGSGEMLREAGQIVEKDFQKLIFKIKRIISNPVLIRKAEKKALNYAKENSWENQALKHYQLASYLISH